MRTLADIFAQIFRTLWAHKLRSFLTMFGIAWGIGSLLLLVGLGEGFRSGNKREMEEFGKESIGGKVIYEVGFSVPGSSNAILTGSYTEGARLALIGNPNTASGDPYNRLNQAAFAAPQVGSRGLEAPRNYLINPGINNWNISLQKEFAFKERARLQLRGDAFNAFNHTQFSGINSTLNISSLTNGTFTNLYKNPDGSINNKNGFGTVSGARDPRIMQLGVRLQF